MPSDKLKEAKLHLTDLRRRFNNRKVTHRGIEIMRRRIAIAEAIVSDYERLVTTLDFLRPVDMDTGLPLFHGIDESNH